ncbi:MAG: sigma-70 family RNA polymerase sigma factor, partial [Verrucomicrobiota bacterium]
MTDGFATTRWTLVLAAGEGTDRALGELCSLYRSPLLTHARRRGLSPADADDAVQGFLARLLRLESLASARRERGRFRAFLLGSFNHYLADLRDH